MVCKKAVRREAQYEKARRGSIVSHLPDIENRLLCDGEEPCHLADDGVGRRDWRRQHGEWYAGAPQDGSHHVLWQVDVYRAGLAWKWEERREECSEERADGGRGGELVSGREGHIQIGKHGAMDALCSGELGEAGAGHTQIDQHQAAAYQMRRHGVVPTQNASCTGEKRSAGLQTRELKPERKRWRG